MKSYTDLEQSKKLAKILPLESADMHYATWTILDNEFIVSLNQGNTIKDLQEDYGNQIIPCWSLAALLSVLCSNANDVRLGGTAWYWWCQPLFSDSAKYIDSMGGDELVDVCCKIIFKLKEENLI